MSGRWAFAATLCLALLASPVAAQDSDECFYCHEDDSLTGERRGREISVFVDVEQFDNSVHSFLECVDCHEDLIGVELPHDDDLAPVDCGLCHDDVLDQLDEGPHADWAGDEAPSEACTPCHGIHDVLSVDDPAAPVHPANVGTLCADCHDDTWEELQGSVHAVGASCSDCHSGHDVVAPITEKQEIAVCGTCHEKAARAQARSVHARAALQGDPLAPRCVDCHGVHDILSHLDARSPTEKMNVPQLCGSCHQEGTQVSQRQAIPDERILQNYSQSIHGEGLYKQGLRVTAVCTSCHRSHDILDMSHPASSINPDNVAATCTACHSRIEQVHVKVIAGELWETEPHKIPSCVDCHRPHKIRRTPLDLHRVAKEECLSCHSDPDLAMEHEGEQVSLFVDAAAYETSSHGNVACAQCHSQVSTVLERPCAAITDPVDCSVCHADVSLEYKDSTHGRLAAEGDEDAPTCLSCHSAHETQGHDEPGSPTFARNVPQLCGTCHADGEVAEERIHNEELDVVDSYVHSIHGRGVLEAGLVVSATCADCHTAHHELPADSTGSSVHPANVAATCGTCHKGIEEIFKTSIHWPGNGAAEGRRLPTCESCHSSHQISRTDQAGFRTRMMDQCGTCHEDEAGTYFETVHGKVSRLGDEGAAKCYDCHGVHDILPPENPASALSHDNVVGTCASCHPGAQRQFAGYLTHATHHDPEKYPYLYWVYIGMTTLLVGTLSAFLLHTLLWLFRLWRTRETWRLHREKAAAPGQRFYERFTRQQRLMHLVMILSFFTLTITGMTLKFSYMGWASWISHALGGFEVTGTLHRIAAVALLGLFVFHLRQVAVDRAASGKSWLRYLLDRNSMVPNAEDARQLWQNLKWFFGQGERPHYGRFTYWEKFDYFAVFWGVFVIGGTGLILWFPTFFTRFMPGWSVNVATIIHSDEALLATAFIFTIHFFNTHFRPDKFPMDPVIFTGTVPVDELAHDKPGEYEDLMASDNPEARLRGPVSETRLRLIRLFGFCAVALGLTLVGLIIYAMVFGYR
jgi:cytochrome b subunit of formate dehydrogenase/nitrate/TMAO reductase-like tetraheme cytochrome c subunit